MSFHLPLRTVPARQVARLSAGCLEVKQYSMAASALATLKVKDLEPHGYS